MSVVSVQRSDGLRFQAYGQRHGKTCYLGTFTSRREAEDAIQDNVVKHREPPLDMPLLMQIVEEIDPLPLVPHFGYRRRAAP